MDVVDANLMSLHDNLLCFLSKIFIEIDWKSIIELSLHKAEASSSTSCDDIRGREEM